MNTSDVTMRLIKEEKEVEQLTAFCYRLCQDKTKASYPLHKTRKEIEDELVKSARSQTAAVVAFYNKETLIGVCTFYWIPQEGYLQTTILLCDLHYEECSNLLFEYWKKEFTGYLVYIGFTSQNQEAKQYMESKKMTCIEASSDTRLWKKDFTGKSKSSEVTLLPENALDEYIIFHNRYCKDMYWNGKRIKKNPKKFQIYVYREDGIIKGSLFLTIYNEKRKAEIFGSFISEEVSEEIRELLIETALTDLYETYKQMNEVLYFIEEDHPEELKAALHSGFHLESQYRCYQTKL